VILAAVEAPVRDRLMTATGTADRTARAAVAERAVADQHLAAAHPHRRGVADRPQPAAGHLHAAGLHLGVPGRYGLILRPERRPAGAHVQRARVRLSPRGRRLAALLGRPACIRIRRHAVPAAGREDWVEAWIRIDSADAAVLDVLALGAEVEVVHPPELRAEIAETARRIADLHASRTPPP